MMVVLLVAGIGLLLAGLVAIGFGIQINEFSLGNTLIVAGTVAACTGMLLLGLWTAVKELKTIARRLGPGGANEPARKPAIRLAATRPLVKQRIRAQPGSDNAGNMEPARARLSPPWHGEAAPRAIARRTIARLRPAPSPRRPPSRGATCCFHRHPARSASVPRRDPIHL